MPHTCDILCRALLQASGSASAGTSGRISAGSSGIVIGDPENPIFAAYANGAVRRDLIHVLGGSFAARAVRHCIALLDFQGVTHQEIECSLNLQANGENEGSAEGSAGISVNVPGIQVDLTTSNGSVTVTREVSRAKGAASYRMAVFLL